MISQNRITEIRNDIDKLDAHIARLLCQRMDLVTEIATEKQKNNLSVQDGQREAEIFAALSKNTLDAYFPYLRKIYEEILKQSRCYQNERRNNA